ncbi:energy transducer TonB [Pseudomonas sp. UL073]|uniref:Protein TonB n=1 Tax=Zestomonas insulae TaxID=2809017 RepID=A0ABS2IJJ5_9GAMM|nr:energy transducer TonB [Pseudomonas insulae]MBM7063137.1 energy transducer TonB [Pseudomonas insulae]
MARIPLYVLLSLTLHAAFGWLLQGQWLARAYSQARFPEAPAMLVMLAPVAAPKPTPAVTPPAVAPAKPAPVAEAKPVKPLEVPKLAQAKLQLKANPKPKPEPLRKPAKTQPLNRPTPAPESLASSPLTSPQAAPAPQSPPTAVEEVLSREPAFLEPPKQPTYPSLARRRNQQGVVLVEVRLDSQGTQRELKVLRSSGVESLDRAALAAVAGWRFRPETQNGKAVPSRVQIPIQFALTASR